MILETAIQAARAAGRILVEQLPAEREIRIKGLRDIVTDADLAAEEAIIQTIQPRFPDHGLLTEEGGGEHQPDDAYVWVIDPLDGTTNYSRRFPAFSVSIGVVHRGQLLAGVVYDPLSDHLFAGERERGATLNGVPLQVSQLDQLARTVIGMDWAHSQKDRREIVALLGRITPACGTLRANGSAALGMCYVAAGWVDAYFHLNLKPWDIAAGLLIIEEAGGRVTDLQGRTWKPWGHRALASNGHIHQDLLEVMGRTSETAP